MTQTAVALEKLGQILKIENAKETQVAGSHYKNRKMEPLDFLQEVAVYYGYTVASATKYLLRYKNKGQWQDDLLKVAHYSRLHEMEQDQGIGINSSLLYLPDSELDSIEDKLIAKLPDVGVALDSKAAEMFKHLIRFAREYATGGVYTVTRQKLFDCISEEISNAK